MFGLNTEIAEKFGINENAVLFHGSCLDLLKQIPDRSMQLIVTSPPYNIGKEYEKKLKIETYIKQQVEVIQECARVLADTGNICWQVGNYVDNGAIIPLDTILYPIFHDLNLDAFVKITLDSFRFSHQIFSKRGSFVYHFTQNFYNGSKRRFYAKISLIYQ